MNGPIQMDMIRINQLQSEIDALYHEASQALNISDSVSIILYELCQHGDRCTQSDLGRWCALPKQTVHSAIRKLEREGYVRLEGGSGRAVLILLTDTGHRLVEEKAHPLIRLENEVLSDWTAEEMETYVRLTRRFRDGMREKIPTLRKTQE